MFEPVTNFKPLTKKEAELVMLCNNYIIKTEVNGVIDANFGTARIVGNGKARWAYWTKKGNRVEMYNDADTGNLLISCSHDPDPFYTTLQ